MIFSTKFERITNNKTLINGSLYSLFSFFGQGCNFLILILVAGYILPADYGKLSIFNTIATFSGYLIGLSTYGYVSISYFRETYSVFRKDFTAIIFIHALSFLVLTLVASLLTENMVKALETTRPLLYYALIISFGNLMFNIHQDYLRIKERLKGYGIWSVGNALLNFILTIIFVISFRQGWLGRINAQLVCMIIFATLALISFYHTRLFHVNYSWKRYRTILLFGLPMIPHLASLWIKQGLDRYIINYHYSTYEVGIFSFAINLVTVIVMIGSAFNATNSVTLYQILGNKTTSNVEKHMALRRQTKTIALVYIAASAAYVLCIVPICYLALPKYTPAIPYFLILCGYGLLQCFYFLYCNYMFFYKETKQLMYITFGSSLLHLALSLLLTQYSLYLTAIIYVLVQAVILVLVRHYAHRILQQNLPLSVQ
ncbi:lipopolysaccharide biosynthesis protein [Segatella maculosa]|uniref:lipopolysaccharide biosynthesis protein n=1 Tax=Segatella maculosa TaxID=439703 RepID=UPI000372376E|nr:oligosaccharide flippase family protein [Segatella maculosa]